MSLTICAFQTKAVITEEEKATISSWHPEFQEKSE